MEKIVSSLLDSLKNIKIVKWHQLNGYSFFSELSRREKMKFAAVCHHRTFKRYENIYLEGKPGEAVFFLLTGSVELYKKEANGAEHRIQYFTPESIFGYTALFSDEARESSARALEKTELLALFRSDFLHLCQAEPMLALKVLTRISMEMRKHLSSLQQDYLSLTSRLTQANIVV